MHKDPPSISISISPPNLIHPGRMLTYASPPRAESESPLVSSAPVKFGRCASNSPWGIPPGEIKKSRSEARVGWVRAGRDLASHVVRWCSRLRCGLGACGQVDLAGRG
ncbi:hypothetical protein SCP_0901770 [Sparassis crispa]|uniref:Uncharacterized protein n=1 Tax=Sparassis crispa TaxID=139825 RepID=A0A401GVP6_9APHY|nr:hypothetical protein SCP_0901770 [Sparassis crispa]GBE86298.1 hypothetical protein SCP_0901770 [Sparassis crispa]